MEIVEADFSHQEAHQDEIARHRQSSVGEMEGDQAHKSSIAVAGYPVGPCPAFMPAEVVQNGGFNRKRRGEQVTKMNAGR